MVMEQTFWAARVICCKLLFLSRRSSLVTGSKKIILDTLELIGEM
jgi:hypothetical protein